MKKQATYFHVTRGMRGCYMADESRVECATSFREFAAIVRDERDASDLVSTGQTRYAWQHVKRNRSWHEVCVATNHGRGEFMSAGVYGVCVSPATQTEYDEQQDADNA